MHLEVSFPAKRLRDVDVEGGGQRPVDDEVRGLRLEG